MIVQVCSIKLPWGHVVFGTKCAEKVGVITKAAHGIDLGDWSALQDQLFGENQLLLRDEMVNRRAGLAAKLSGQMKFAQIEAVCQVSNPQRELKMIVDISDDIFDDLAADNFNWLMLAGVEQFIVDQD